ncbi:MAG: hypothetical protein N2260_06450 [Syntrophobacterales bacterium]|nr:hypothetical protein [Syntrophobacterales bacterium]
MYSEDAIQILKELVAFIENNHVFDRISDSGCGYIDPHRSDAFQNILDRAKALLEKV